MRYFIVIIFIIVCKSLFGQVDDSAERWFEKYVEYSRLSGRELKDSLNNYDISGLINHIPSDYVYGVIGKNMQRIQIKWHSIIKDSKNSNTYIAKGKTKVSNNVCSFQGTITIRTIRKYEDGDYDLPYRCKIQPEMIGVIFCDYILYEDTTNSHSGIFKGISATEFYIFTDSLKYNDLRAAADDMSNNQFVGTWSNYTNDRSLLCNWGDFRVPNIEGLDCGASEFAPCENYWEHGWRDFYFAKFMNDSVAITKEKMDW